MLTKEQVAAGCECRNEQSQIAPDIVEHNEAEHLSVEEQTWRAGYEQGFDDGENEAKVGLPTDYWTWYESLDEEQRAEEDERCEQVRDDAVEWGLNCAVDNAREHLANEDDLKLVTSIILDCCHGKHRLNQDATEVQS